MKFSEVVEQASVLLQRKGRLMYRALKREFNLDDDALADLKFELITGQELAVDKDGDVLVWAGEGEATPKPTSPPAQSQPPVSYTPPHLAERILAEREALAARGAPDGERKTITALFADLKGSTALIEGLDPEEARAIIDPALHPKYRPDIDGLRGIAVLSVVGFHAFPLRIKGGFIGVDIFFVISGFLIATIIFESLERNQFSFLEFYSRRIRRIFPALITVLAASFAFGWFTLLSDQYQQFGKHMAGGAGFVSNFILRQESGYFDNAAETKPLLHLWSLGVEEQFYILYPTLLWVAWKCRVNLLAVTLVIALVSFGLGLKVIQTDPVAAFYSPQTRLWELMLGAVLAYLALHNTRTLAKVRHTLDDWLSRLTYAHLLKENSATLSNVQSWFGLALIGISLVGITKETRFPGGWALFPTLGAALLITGGTQAWINRKFLSNRILVWFGLISFPLYLWHWVALTFPRVVAGEYPSGGIRVAAVILSTVLAWLTVVLVEKPLRFGKHNGTKASGLIVLLIVVGYGGYRCNQGGGFPFRNAANPAVKNEGDLGHDKFVKYLSRKFFLCTPIAIRNDAVLSKGIRRCFQSKENAPVDIALVGDSHAEHLFLGLAENLPQKNIAYYMKGGVPVIDNERFAKIFDYLISDKTIKKVIIAAYWTHKGVTLARLLPTIRELKARGKQVIVTDDVPSFQFSPSRCKYERLFIFENRCLQGRDSALRWNKLVYRHSQEIVAQNPDVKIIYTSQYFCDSSYCFMGKNGKLLFRDEHHLSINGSKYVGEKMIYDLPILND